MSAALKNLRTHPTAKPVGNLRTSAITPANQLRSRSVVESSCIRWLFAEEGLGWRLQEADASPGGHQLVVFADSVAQPQDPSSAQGGGLRYHRSDATEAADSVLAIGATRRLGSGRLTVLSEDFKTRQARSAQLPLHGGGRQSLREVYEPVGM
ncbi:contractile injection system protein, VgrG/Pvc8 family, partial [Xanthomonas oryzae]|uniref:contractile injection system protein, VgrG/Pvc8 family n=1 Tax=Xanthomonas oryzae TaxID=347 RepID=UPI000E11E3AE